MPEKVQDERHPFRAVTRAVARNNKRAATVNGTGEKSSATYTLYTPAAT
jgi:hypothetical protein